MQELWHTYSTWIIAWVFASIAVGIYWRRKGKPALAGFVLSLLLSPITGMAFAVLFFERSEELPNSAFVGGRMSTCPSCGGMSSSEARACGLCGSALPSAPKAPPDTGCVPRSAIQANVPARARAVQLVMIAAIIAMLLIGASAAVFFHLAH